MTGPERPTPGPELDATRAGLTVLTAFGVAMLLIVAAGAVGIGLGMRGGAHAMMWGGPDAPSVSIKPGDGFQIDGLSPNLAMHYTSARANPQAYAAVPCFCGCEQMLGHRNLEDCFVTPDGAWEPHASGCQVCIDESQMLMRMMGRGMGPGMMRDRIVAGFGGPMMGG